MSCTPESNNKNTLLLNSLEAFYRNRSHRAEFMDVILQRSKLSLRVLDSLATNYSKNHTVLYSVTTPQGQREFNMYTSYKAQLKAYSKKAFDPFCRRSRISLPLKDDVTGEQVRVCTTIGQLNFFRWAIMNGVLAYAAKHQKAIEKDMVVQTHAKRIALIKEIPNCRTTAKSSRRNRLYPTSRKIVSLRAATSSSSAVGAVGSGTGPASAFGKDRSGPHLSDSPEELRILVSFN